MPIAAVAGGAGGGGVLVLLVAGAVFYYCRRHNTNQRVQAQHPTDSEMNKSEAAVAAKPQV